jgi:replicative DNA helicase
MYDIVIGRGEGDRKKYGKRGTIFLGKHYVKMGQTMSLSNNIYMDIARAHVISVFGKRGGGKCLAGDTIITLTDGSQVQIKDLEHSLGQVCSLTKDLKISGATASHFYKREVTKLVELTLRSGKSIKLTPEHPLLTVKGWLPVDSLSLGERIATPRKLDFFGNASLTEPEVKILAYLLSEGHLSNNFILFTNKDEHIMSDFKNAVLSFSNRLEFKQHGKYSVRIIENNPLQVLECGKRNSKGQFIEQSRYANRKSSLRNWLDKYGIYGKLAHEREIIQVLFQLPKQKLSLFLNRLFSCDGSIHKKGDNYWAITYSTSSKNFIQQIHHLLLKFGILSTIRTKKTYRRDHFELTIRGESVSMYLQEIGFFSYKDSIATQALLSVVDIKRNPNLDVIPKEIWSIYRPSSWSSLGRNLGYSTPKSARGTMDYGVSRQKLLQIAQSEQSELLTALATSDIYWDEIQSIRYLDEAQMVYDITVPENHNFIANDIIVHNSYTLGVVAEGLADIEPEIAQNLVDYYS